MAQLTAVEAQEQGDSELLRRWRQQQAQEEQPAPPAEPEPEVTESELLRRWRAAENARPAEASAAPVPAPAAEPVRPDPAPGPEQDESFDPELEAWRPPEERHYDLREVDQVRRVPSEMSWRPPMSDHDLVDRVRKPWHRDPMETGQGEGNSLERVDAQQGPQTIVSNRPVTEPPAVEDVDPAIERARREAAAAAPPAPVTPEPEAPDVPESLIPIRAPQAPSAPSPLEVLAGLAGRGMRAFPGLDRLGGELHRMGTADPANAYVRERNQQLPDALRYLANLVTNAAPQGWTADQAPPQNLDLLASGAPMTGVAIPYAGKVSPLAQLAAGAMGTDFVQPVAAAGRAAGRAVAGAASDAMRSAERTGQQLAGIDPATGRRVSETLGVSMGAPPPSGGGRPGAAAAAGQTPPTPPRAGSEVTDAALDAAQQKMTTAARAGDIASGLRAMSQLPPDAIVRQAERTVQQAQEAGFKGVRLTPEQTASIRAQAEAVNAMPDGRQKLLATAQLQNQIARAVPPTVARRLSTWQVIAQLGNLKTLERNVLANTLFAAAENVSQLIATGLDIPLSKATGKRSITAPSLRAQAAGFARGAREGTEEALSSVNLSGAGDKFTLAQPGRTFQSGPLSMAETGLSLGLRVPDAAAAGAAFDDALHSMAKAQGLTEKLSGEALSRRTLELLAAPTREMTERAQTEALYRTFNDDTLASALFEGIKKSLNTAGIGRRVSPDSTNPLTRYSREFGLGDFVIKYPKVPANILMRAVDYSPYGFLRSATELAKHAAGRPFDQRAFVMSAGRALVGTAGLTATGFMLGQLGLVRGKGSNDFNVRRYQDAEGIMPYSVNATGLKRFVLSGFDPAAAKVQDGDRWATFEWAAPLSISFGYGANRAENAAGRGGPLASRLAALTAPGGVLHQLSRGATANLEGLAVGLDTLSEQSLVEGVTDLFSGGAENPVEGLINVLKQAPASMVPALLSQAVAALDSTVRERHDPGIVNQALNSVLAKVPLLAATLPDRHNQRGLPEDRWTDNESSLFNAFINPSRVLQYLPEADAKMVLDLYQATGQTSHVPRSAPHRFTASSGLTYELTGEQVAELQRIMGEKTREVFTAFAGQPDFRSQPPEKQVEALSRLLAYLSYESQQELRKMAQEPGSRVSPLPKPEPARSGAGEPLSEKNAREYASDEPLLRKYDAIPDLLRQGTPAYDAALRAVEEAETARRFALRGDDPAAIAKADADLEAAQKNPNLKLYEAGLREQRLSMRQKNPSLDAALGRWRGLDPVRQPGAATPSPTPTPTRTPAPTARTPAAGATATKGFVDDVVAGQAAQAWGRFNPDGSPLGYSQFSGAERHAIDAHIARLDSLAQERFGMAEWRSLGAQQQAEVMQAAGPVALPQTPTATATGTPTPYGTPGGMPTPTATPDPASTPKTGATPTKGYADDLWAQRAAQQWGRLNADGSPLLYNQMTAPERRAIDAHIDRLDKVASDLYKKEWRSLTPAQQKEVEAETERRFGPLLPPGSPTPRPRQPAQTPTPTRTATPDLSRLLYGTPTATPSPLEILAGAGR